MTRIATILSLIFVFAPAASAAAAADAYVKITSPSDGAKLDAMTPTKLAYEVVPGPKGDHVHVYVGDKEVGILRQLKGSYTLDTLPAGHQRICVKVVNKAHVPIGVERCVEVTVE